MDPQDPQHFEMMKMAARMLEMVEKSGKPLDPPDMFCPQAQCHECGLPIELPKTPQVCAECKAVLYCSKQCQKRSWKVPPMPNAQTHKELCADNKRHMRLVPQVRAVISQFPWGRVEPDGTFNIDVTRARFNVLGGPGVGFWSHKGGRAAHQDNGPLGKRPDTNFHHLDGGDMLRRRNHFTDEDGWKLQAKLIPYRDLDNIKRERRPVLVTDFPGGVLDWTSWYKWRKLSMESPAALLMDYPLSVYQLTVHTLGLTMPAAGSPGKRVSLNVHLLGAEVELNFIPLFSELALLLPYHDIKLTIFGFSARRLAEAAHSEGAAKSVARDALENTGTPLFEYTAPEHLGGGIIKIYIYGASDVWNDAALKVYGRPDAIVACNAGLGAYPQWVDVIRSAHLNDIPFAVTEYAEQSAELQTQKQFPRLISPLPARDYKVELNPFHKPGQRWMSRVRMPNMYNGFTIKVVGGPNQDAPKRVYKADGIN